MLIAKITFRTGGSSGIILVLQWIFHAYLTGRINSVLCPQYGCLRANRLPYPALGGCGRCLPTRQVHPLFGAYQFDSIFPFFGIVQNPRYLVKTFTSINAATETPIPYISISNGSKVTPKTSMPKN